MLEKNFAGVEAETRQAEASVASMHVVIESVLARRAAGSEPTERVAREQDCARHEAESKPLEKAASEPARFEAASHQIDAARSPAYPPGAAPSQERPNNENW